MLYRVVLQGCAAAGADVENVKQAFVRVTALPRNVADQLFDGTAKVLKRELSEADAERIAQTLRAIGAPATVEPEPVVPGEADGTILPPGPARSALGPPTFSPATSPRPAEAPDPKPPKRPPSRRNLLLLGGLAAVLVAVFAAPVYDEWVRRIRGAPAPPATPSKPVAEPATAPERPAFKASALEGPWRCTDQSSGVSTYWEYRGDGALWYFGDNTTRTERPQSGEGVPTRWSLEGDRLTWTFEARPPIRLALVDLSLVRLDYRTPAQDEVRCLRP